MKLLALPAELLLAIAGDLEPKELNSLLQTNRYLGILLTPLLHKIALQDKDGIPALSWAAQSNYEPLVRLILSTNGSSDIDALEKSPRGVAALHLAVARGYEGVARILLENGANADVRDKSGLTPLVWVGNGMVEMARLLLDYGADVNPRNRVRATSLCRAVWREDVAMARLLLEGGAKIIGLEGRVLDGLAAKKNNDLVETLLEIGGARDDCSRKELLRLVGVRLRESDMGLTKL